MYDEASVSDSGTSSEAESHTSTRTSPSALDTTPPSPSQGHHQQQQSVPSLFALHATPPPSSSTGASGGGVRISNGLDAPHDTRPHAHVAVHAARHAPRPREPAMTRPTGNAIAATTTSTLSTHTAASSSNSSNNTIDYADIEQKQSELRHVVEGRILGLERSLAAREAELQRVQAQLRKVEEDYEFNYNLIRERDGALAEAAAQLQRLYRDLKRVAQEKAALEEQLAQAQAECSAAQAQLRESDAAHASELRRVQEDYATKEQHLRATLQEKAAALEAERDAMHRQYLERLQGLGSSPAHVHTGTSSEEVRAGGGQDTTAAAVPANALPAAAHSDEATRTTVSDIGGADVRRRLQQMQEELQATAQQWHHTRSQFAEADRARHSLQEQLATLQQAHTLLQEQHKVIREQARLEQEGSEGRIAQLTAQLQQRTESMEAALRAEAARAAQLEREKDTLQSTLREADAQVQQLRAQAASTEQRYTTQLQEMTAHYEAARSAMAESARQHESAVQQLQRELGEKTDTMNELRAELERTSAVAQRHEEQGRALRQSTHALQQELMQCKHELEQCQAELTSAQGQAQYAREAANESHARLTQGVAEAQAESEQLRHRLQELQERSQGEIARLTRELNVSEAARRQAEEQCRQLQDGNAQRAQLQQLQLDKEALQHHVLELEQTNREVREQVGRFTMELQNDPVLRAAKETQRKVVTLQQDLLRAQDELQRVRDALHEREEELARCQVELLRAQLLTRHEDGDNNSSSTAARKTHAATTKKIEDAMEDYRHDDDDNGALRREYERLREAYRRVTRQLSREQRRRHRSGSSSSSKRRKATKSADDDRDVVHSPSKHHNSNTSSTSDDDDHGDGGQPRHARDDGRRGTTGPRTRSMSSQGVRRGHTRPDTTKAAPHEGTSRSAYLLQEAELWRRKYMQLEDQLRTVLRERDGLQRELRRARQDVQALTSEKQSLVELNALLKAQLREFCRTSSAASASKGVHTPSITTSTTTNKKNAAVQLTPELLAAAAMTLLEHHQANTAHAPSPHNNTNDTGTPPAQQQPVALSSQPPIASAADALPRTQPAQPQTYNHNVNGMSSTAQHLAALEDEIVSLKSQIAATMRQGSLASRTAGKRSPAQHTAVHKGASAVASTMTAGGGSNTRRRGSVERPAVGSANTRAGVVVRKGTNTVRHYGYQ